MYPNLFVEHAMEFWNTTVQNYICYHSGKRHRHSIFLQCSCYTHIIMDQLSLSVCCKWKLVCVEWYGVALWCGCPNGRAVQIFALALTDSGPSVFKVEKLMSPLDQGHRAAEDNVKNTSCPNHPKNKNFKTQKDWYIDLKELAALV